MSPQNNHNVYKGPNSVRDYFDPDTAPPLPLVEVPESLNPYRQDGVRIYAKMMSMHPANNVKCMPGKLEPLPRDDFSNLNHSTKLVGKCRCPGYD